MKVRDDVITIRVTKETKTKLEKLAVELAEAKNALGLRKKPYKPSVSGAAHHLIVESLGEAA